MHNKIQSAQTERILQDALVWDNHGCMPMKTDERFLPQLWRYKQSGVDMVSLNVSFDLFPWHHTVRMLAHFRRWLAARPDEYVLALTVEDIQQAKNSSKLAVAFDIEGASAIDDQISLISLYYDLGVRWMLMAYNKNNRAGGGCQDEDKGLTEFGRQALAEMARVGMVACCSHTGERTALDMIAYSKNPVILSHSNPLAVWKHKRNVSDRLMRAVAATGGVMGINGIGTFLGLNDNSTATFLRHIDYAVQTIGAAHVGLGLDFCFDQQELTESVRNNPEMYPESEGYTTTMKLIEPERIPEITEGLIKLGYDESDIRGILGENFLRVCKQVWK